MAALQQIFGTPPLPLHKFSGEVSVVGRHDDCEVVLDSPAVSRYHVKIYCENNHYFIEDLNSRNGTSVNGVRIQGRMLLNDGDQIEISTLPFKFLTEDSLTEASGSWGVKPKIVSISKDGSDSDENSLRRLLVGAGDRISNEQLGSDGLRQGQVLGRIQMDDGAGAWPVISNATLKLNQTLQLLYSLRQATHPDDVFSRTMQVLFDVFPAAAHLVVVVRNAQGTGIDVAAAVARQPAKEVCVCLPMIRTAMHGSEALLYAEHWNHDDAAQRDTSVSGMLVVPLLNVVGHTIGAIQIDSCHGGESLTTADLEQMVVLSQVISFAFEQSTAAQQLVELEVTNQGRLHARQMQYAFLPAAAPVVAGYRLAHEVFWASNVAGDLVDYVTLPDGRVSCVLIDVPGRGLEATRLMALLSRLLTDAINQTGSPAAALEHTRTALQYRLDSVPFLVFVSIVILDPGQSGVKIAVAGHCPCVLVRGQEITEYTNESFLGPPLGAEGATWQESELPLNDDDVLLMCSDGITKLTSPDRTTLSRTQRSEIILEAAQGDRSILEIRLKKRLQEFQGDGQLSDDLAFAMIHRRQFADTIDSSGMPPIESETMPL